MNQRERNIYGCKLRRTERFHKGWVLLPGVYREDLAEQVKAEFIEARVLFQDIQKKKGLSSATKNATHHTLRLCRSMLELLEENRVNSVLELYFGGNFILNTTTVPTFEWHFFVTLAS